MCLIALAWQVHPQYPVVIAANRDEFHDRPAASMRWWDDRNTLAGRDLKAGGTWLGISRSGRIGVLTNVREPGGHDGALISRGNLVRWWLDSDHDQESLTRRLDGVETNGFSLLGLDVTHRQAHCWSNRFGHRKSLPPGIYGLSNAALDEPWPKLQRIKQHLRALVDSASGAHFCGRVDRLIETLLHGLTDRHQPADHELPSTGVHIGWERALARVFIEAPQERYGTRCSTAIVLQESSGGAGWRLHVAEQSWTALGLPGPRVNHQIESPS